MKFKTLTISLIALFALTNQSCKKEGCTNPSATNYFKAATKDDGSCKFAADAIKSTSIALSQNNWFDGGSFYYATINWGEITQDLIDNGVLMVYMNYNNYSIALPYTWYINSSYSESLTFSYTVGSVEIDVTDSDLTTAAYIYPNTFKLVAISNTGRKEAAENKIDLKNYTQVANYFHLDK